MRAGNSYFSILLTSVSEYILKVKPTVLDVELGENRGKLKIALRFRAKATQIDIGKSMFGSGGVEEVIKDKGSALARRKKVWKYYIGTRSGPTLDPWYKQ